MGAWYMRQNEESDNDSEKSFICERCVEAMKGIVKLAEELTFYDQLEAVKFLLFGGQIKCRW